jgi:hypothetical protein
MDNESYKREVMWAWGTALSGLMIAFMLWAGGHPMIFVFTWGPQAAVLALMFFIGARPAAIAGAALGFTAFLMFFNWWVDVYVPTDGLVWLLYLFSMPGGLLAGIAAAVRLKIRDERPALNAGFHAATLVLAGIAVNYLSLHLAFSS